MGILDSASNVLKGAAEGTGRATKSFQLKSQLNDVAKQRSAAAAQLGASLFEETRNNSAFRASREDLYSAIEALDNQRDALQAEINQIEQEAQAAQQAAMTYACPKCGGRVSAADSFCVGCGTPIAEIKKSLNLCPQCGTPFETDAAFCVGCGSPVEASVATVDPASQTVAAAGTDTCGQCGAPLESDALFCTVCGTPVKKEGSSAAAEEPKAKEDTGVIAKDAVVPLSPEPAGESDLNTAEVAVAEGASTAEESKAAQTAEAEKTVADAEETAAASAEETAKEPTADIPGLCPKCGYENIESAKFCFNCGNALK